MVIVSMVAMGRTKVWFTFVVHDLPCVGTSGELIVECQMLDWAIQCLTRDGARGFSRRGWELAVGLRIDEVTALTICDVIPSKDSCH